MSIEVLRSRERAGPCKPPSEQRRIAEIRRQIANGTYLTDAKIDVAVERLCAALNHKYVRVRRASA